MTNEKAIKHLEVIKGDCALVGDIRALDMGILALSAIEKIRAEIKELSELHCIQVMDREDIPLLALEIIDKYIGGKDK